MYTESYSRDALLFAKAVLSNQLARFAPAMYMRLTNETGRGDGDQDASITAAYFVSCVDGYREQLGLDTAAFGAFLTCKRVLEYGPGDILGVALLLYAHGADSVHCVDRFALLKGSGKNFDVYRCIVESLSGPARDRANAAFNDHGKPESGFKQSAVSYFVTPNGLSGKQREYDLIISRAVLEHVNDLDSTLEDVAAALKPDGIAVHQVDLRSHGLDRYKPFDFLTWPDPLYKLMFSQKGFPNRWRTNRYRALIDRVGLRVHKMEPTDKLATSEVALIRKHVAKALGQVPAEELSWMGFWMILAHPNAVGELRATPQH